jgi:hypothetical protein
VTTLLAAAAADRGASARRHFAQTSKNQPEIAIRAARRAAACLPGDTCGTTPGRSAGSRCSDTSRGAR